jgi:hypothetical protein
MPFTWTISLTESPSNVNGSNFSNSQLLERLNTIILCLKNYVSGGMVIGKLDVSDCK